MLSLITDFFSTVFNTAQTLLFEHSVVPALRGLGLSAYTETAFDGTGFFLLGILQIAGLYALLRPMERWRPAEPIELAQERRTDVVYTLLHRLGGFALFSFAILTPLLDSAEAQLRLWGITRMHLERWAVLEQSPLLLFFAYLIVLDAMGYWVHRAQHRYHLWWQLHALHHANRSLSLWSDNRNHLLDDVVLAVIGAVIAWFIGVEPAQFVGLTMLSHMLQSIQHANVRLPFGYIGERLLVSPNFHRAHHSVTSGREGHAMGCNFGVLLPWWDLLFGTAQFGNQTQATGVRDQALGRNYGAGFWAQQQLGVLRVLGKA